MANDRRLAYLSDIVCAIGLTDDFCAGKDIARFKGDLLFRSAVERQFTIIGEAVNQLLQLGCAFEGSISAARQIVGFRNQLIHNYGSIDPDLVWTVIIQDLPALKGECSRLIRRIA
jgi:uncharacterized protein with HEPN domain